MSAPPLLANLPEMFTEDSTILEDSHGWPQELCVIEVAEGKYASNDADTKGLEPDPQIGVKGLAVHPNTDSANRYMSALNGLSGTVTPKTFAECRQIVIDKRGVLTAMFLMDGAKIKDVIHVC